jgi:hypothetical protein
VADSRNAVARPMMPPPMMRIWEFKVGVIVNQNNYFISASPFIRLKVPFINMKLRDSGDAAIVY